MKKLFLFFAIIAINQAWGQANLNLFTEEGEEFILYLNGIQQNNKPKSTVKVQKILDNVQKIRLVFDDKNIQTISQNIYYESGKEYTYIVRQKNNQANKVKRIDGKKIISMVYVLKIQDVKLIDKSIIQNESVLNEKLPDIEDKTTNNGNDNLNLSVNELSTNLNINGSENTSLSVNNQTINTNSNVEGNNIKTNSTIILKPMSKFTFESLKNQIKKQDFEENKIQIIKQVLVNNYLSAAQVKGLIGEFSFENNKVRVAKMCYSKTTDKQNYFTINEAFGFSNSVEEMSEFLKTKEALSNEVDY
ncbi:MAG: DUF4476 domain-containing protein [Bacteroidia bacterium]|nr:DUF4476 domain-containing protein [Bacteroidia bacterium]